MTRAHASGEDTASRLRAFLIFAAALAFVTGAFVRAALAAELTIELPSAIEARAGSFFLGEYAEIDGDARLSAAASMALLAPSGGSLSRDDVIAALAETGAAGASVALRMPETVRVRPENRIAAELRAMSGWKWRIDAAAPEMSETVGFTLPPRVAPGARVVAAKIDDERGRPRTHQVKLRWFQPALLSSKPLSRGEAIDPASLIRAIRQVGMNENLAADPSEIAGGAPRVALPAMRPISTGDLDHAQVVKNGAAIKLVSRVNGLGVEVQGIALQRGAIGDRIRVKNISSKKVLQGTVIAPNKVLIN